MPSPFPGMDPYIERPDRWQDFHGWFIRMLASLHREQARGLGCVLAVERTVYRQDEDLELTLLGDPDVTAEWDGDTDPWQGRPASSSAVKPHAVREVVLDPDDPLAHRQDSLVVRSAAEFWNVLATVELLSSANKRGGYVSQHRLKRWSCLTSRANFLELDLLRAGDNPSRRMFPDIAPSPYFALISRKRAGGRHDEGYAIGLRDPLPVLALPLTPRLPDLQLDLSATLAAAWEESAFAGRINYSQEPVPPPALSDADRQWVAEMAASTKHPLP